MPRELSQSPVEDFLFDDERNQYDTKTLRGLLQYKVKVF